MCEIINFSSLKLTKKISRNTKKNATTFSQDLYFFPYSRFQYDIFIILF